MGTRSSLRTGLSREAKRQRGRAGGRHPQQGTVTLCPDMKGSRKTELHGFLSCLKGSCGTDPELACMGIALPTSAQMLEHPARISANMGRAGASLGPQEGKLGTFGKGNLWCRVRDQLELLRVWLPGLFFRTPGRGRGMGTPADGVQILPVLAPTKPSWPSCVGPAPSSMDGGPKMLREE